MDRDLNPGWGSGPTRVEFYELIQTFLEKRSISVQVSRTPILNLDSKTPCGKSDDEDDIRINQKVH